MIPQKTRRGLLGVLALAGLLSLSACGDEPSQSASTPKWNRIDPRTSWRRRNSCDEPVRQLYCSRSKRITDPSTITAMAI